MKKKALAKNPMFSSMLGHVCFGEKFQKVKMERERDACHFVGKKDELIVKIIIFSFKTNVAEPRLFPRQSGSKVREKASGSLAFLS
jgi:hypothetical protein